jgi:hypothetical protein
MDESVTSRFQGARPEMGTFRPRLLEAETAGPRMDALCAFIPFWLGPRQSSYGESAEALSGRPLPMPLRRLYQFAGRWPHRDHPGPIESTVPAFSHQDGLKALDNLGSAEDGKISFLVENQGNWNCRTLAEGDDPPVWCNGDQVDEEGDFRGERLVCDSLSRFLTTFVLQELTLGSLLCLWDEGLSARFASERDAALPVWTGGPYVSGADRDFYLWGDVLVAELGGSPAFAANHDPGVAFLTTNQGPVRMINLRLGWTWRLFIRSDGSARTLYHRGPTERSAEARPGTFDFPGLLEVLSRMASDEGDLQRDALVCFQREGQMVLVQSKYLHDGELVKSLFRRAMGRTPWKNRALKRLWASEWPV